MAVSIAEALEECPRDVYDRSDLYGRLVIWRGIFSNLTQFDSLATPLRPDSREQRTIMNWLVPTLKVLSELPIIETPDPGSYGFIDKEKVKNIVYKTLKAVQAAQANGWFIGNQDEAILLAYNDAWTSG